MANRTHSISPEDTSNPFVGSLEPRKSPRLSLGHIMNIPQKLVTLDSRDHRMTNCYHPYIQRGIPGRGMNSVLGWGKNQHGCQCRLQSGRGWKLAGQGKTLPSRGKHPAPNPPEGMPPMQIKGCSGMHLVFSRGRENDSIYVNY